EPRGLARDDQVRRAREAGAAREGVAVDGRDERLPEPPDREEEFAEGVGVIQVLEGPGPGRDLLELREVSAGAEVRALAAEEDDADRVVRFRPGERVLQLGDRRGV